MSSFRSNRASRSRERHKNRNGGDRSHRDRRHSPRDRLANVTVRTSSRTRTAYHPLSDSAQRWSDKSRTPSVSPSDEDSDDPDDPDKEGLITFQPGDELRSGRYKVLGLAGQGTFGTVLDVLDTKYNSRVALKVVRSVKRYLEAAQVEVDILEKLRNADPHRDSLCVRLYSTFEITHNGQRHVCIGFERLGRSLYEFIRHNKYRGFRLEAVRSFAYQLIKAVKFCHSIKLTHTDLKLENVLLVNSEYVTGVPGEPSDYRVPASTAIRLIDFGGATFEDDHHSRIVNTRQYRGPEVLLGIGWSYPSDMWSVGCILAELFTGELLFATHEDLEHLALMEKILDRPIPTRMGREALDNYMETHGRSRRSRRSRSRSPGRGRDRGRSRSRSSSPSLSPDNATDRRGRSPSVIRIDKLLHTRDSRLRWPEKASSRQSHQHVYEQKTLTELIPDRQFLDLLRGLLTMEPELRLTAAEALEHRFFDPIREQDRRGEDWLRSHLPSSNRSSSRRSRDSRSSNSLESARSGRHRDSDRERECDRDRGSRRSSDRERRRRDRSSHSPSPRRDRR